MGFRYWLDPVEHVVGLIEKWNPRGCHREKDYERSLARFLQDKLKGKQIISQFGIGKARGDIVVDNQVLIEVKVNLDSTSKLQKLIGQIDIYANQWKKALVVVLCGKHDSQLVSQLEKSVQRRVSTIALLDSPWLKLVVK